MSAVPAASFPPSQGDETTLTIRHVPREVRNVLAARAARGGRSLQEYMLREVVAMASRPSIDDLVAEVRDEKRAHGVQLSTAELLADRDAERR